MIRSIRPTLALACAGALALPVAALGDGDETPQGAEKEAKFAEMFERLLAAHDDDCTLIGCEAEHTCDSPGGCEACEYVCPIEAMVTTLNADPASWELFAPAAAETFTDRSTDAAQREGILAVLSWAGDRGMALATELLDEEPKGFAPRHVLLFAEIGAEDFEAPLARLAKRAGRGDASVLPAAYFVSRGDDAHARVVRKVAESECGECCPVEMLAAAAALRGIGDSGTLRDAQIRVHDACIAALDAGDLDLARKYAVAATYFVHDVDVPGELVLSRTDVRYVGPAFEKMAKGLASAEEVYAAIEKVTPL